MPDPKVREVEINFKKLWRLAHAAAGDTPDDWWDSTCVRDSLAASPPKAEFIAAVTPHTVIGLLVAIGELSGSQLVPPTR